MAMEVIKGKKLHSVHGDKTSANDAKKKLQRHGYTGISIKSGTILGEFRVGVYLKLEDIEYLGEPSTY